MRVEEAVIIVFFLGVSCYALYYLMNLANVKNKILMQLDGKNIATLNAYQNYFKTIKTHPNIATKKTFIKADAFLNLEKLLQDNGLNIRLYLAIPSLLVGLGVLGTFIGFSLTVWSVGDLLDNTDQQEAMKKLFASVKIAFASSVAGMFWSFIFSKYEKIIFHHLEAKIDALCHQLDDFHYLSHDEYIRGFVANIETTFVANINHAFTQNINHSFKLINDNLQQTMSDLLKEPLAALEKQSQSLEVQLNKWESSLNAQNNIIISSTAQLASLPATIKKQTDDISESFSLLNKDVNLTLKKLTSTNHEIDSYVHKWENAIQSQANAIKQQEDSVKNINAILSTIPNMTQELDKINKTFEKTVKAFEKTEKTLTASIGNISDSVNQAMNTLPQLDITINKVQNSIDDFSHEISIEHSELKIMIDTLEKTIKTVFQGLDNTIEQRMTRTSTLLNDYFSAIDQLAEKIVNTYAATDNES